MLSRCRNLSSLQNLCKSGRCISLATTVVDFKVKNEPVLEYLYGTTERHALQSALAKYSGPELDIPIVIGGKRIYCGEIQHQITPFDHSKSIARYFWASQNVMQMAIVESQKAQDSWESTPLSDRIKLFLKAADLVSGKYRMDLNAATMLGQGKTVIQAEIDAAAELADFLRFNAYFAKELTKYQPISTQPSVSKNTMRYRGLEGFIASISPFNFTAIGGNLGSGPTIMGNVVLWKPSDTAVLSNYLVFQIFEEAGFPPGVINFLPCHGAEFGKVISSSPLLAGINFTGSLNTFQVLWRNIGNNMHVYKNFPRLVGECGGKNFHFVHSSADVDTVVVASIKSAFEYSGQKCSAVSRMYVPESLWPKIREGLLETRNQLKLGSPLELDSFLSAVIDERAFKKIRDYILYAKDSADLAVLGGGKCNISEGYYIEPTIIQTRNPTDIIMREEIFGPVLVVYVYKDADLQKTLQLVKDSKYALTGAVFATDREFVESATEFLKMAAGNFYINDKSTGSVVGQQPFGGGRLSGTNDKAGGPHYLLRFASPQVIKETFVPLRDWKYPYMEY